MNIIEAIRSGRPFKRPSMSEWMVCNKEAGYFQSEGDGEVTYLNEIEIWDSVFLCDDWELKDSSVTLTEQEFDHVCAVVLDDRRVTIGMAAYIDCSAPEFIKHLKRRLFP